MKIAYIANVRFPTEKAHGAAIAKACEALTKAGEDVTLFVPNRTTHILTPALQYYDIRTSFSIVRVANADTVSFGKLGFWFQSLMFGCSVLLRLRSQRYDIVYGRDEIVLAILALCGVKNIYWESHDGTWNRASRYIAGKAQGIVVVSRGLEQFYKEQGVNAEKLYAVANGIDLSEFAQSEDMRTARARLGISQDKKIALYIGRLDGWKGSDTLLQAAQLLPDDIQVVIIGGEEQQVARLKTQYPNVQFVGYRPYSELHNNQAAADVLVVPNTAKNPVSVRFTSPLKLIAHMASHRPIVASDLPSIRELVDDTCAVLVEPDSPQALADGIKQALQSKSISEEAFTRVSALDWSSRAKHIVDFLRRRVVV